MMGMPFVRTEVFALEYPYVVLLSPPWPFLRPQYLAILSPQTRIAQRSYFVEQLSTLSARDKEETVVRLE